MALFLTWVLCGLSTTGAVAQDASTAEGWKEHDEKLVELEAELKTLAKQIQAVQGESKCVSNRECHILALGAPLCGYAKDYIIYSTQDADEGRLLERVAAFNRVHKRVLDLSFSTQRCGVKPSRVACVKRQCVPVGAPSKRGK